MSKGRKESPLVSIIVPVYNTSAYLNKCLQSLLNQTLKNIEVVVVNDCSPDPIDHKICEDYEKRYSNLIYKKHDVNLGLGGARNTGLQVASGDYIWFVDSDDYVDLNACEYLANYAVEKKADVVAFSATSHVNGSLDLGGMSYYNYNRDVSILNNSYSGRQFIEVAILAHSFHVSACLHLFESKLISRYRFRENVVHEDTDLIPMVIHEADVVVCTKYAPYYRLLRKGSITQSKVSEKVLMDKVACMESLLNYLTGCVMDPDDPLVVFAAIEFDYLSGMYLKYNEKTELTDNVFNLMKEKYENVVGVSHPDVPVLENNELMEKYLSLRNEMINIKSSRFWAISNFLRRMLGRL